MYLRLCLLWDVEKEDPIPDPTPTPPGKGGLNGKITLWIREKSSNLTDQ